MAKKQTAGRDQLGEFAPKFAELNDDVLFGQVWAEMITQLAFYVGWPNAWSAFNIAKEVWGD